MKLVIDHIRGTRAGQRQVVTVEGKLSFGRHPDNDVAFDARGDLDASSRHAVLEIEAGGARLRDVGSSNGTWVAGDRVEETVIVVAEPVEIEFGSGGPVLRLWLGDSESDAPEPPGRAQLGGGPLIRLVRRVFRGQ